MLIPISDTSARVVTQASLVVAESIGVLKVQAVEYLDALVPTYLSILRSALKEEETVCQDNLVIASAMAIHRVSCLFISIDMGSTPWGVSAYAREGTRILQFCNCYLRILY